MLGITLATDFTVTEHVRSDTLRSAGWATLRCRTFTGRSSLPGYSTQQVHGTASPRQLTVDVLTYC